MPPLHCAATKGEDQMAHSWCMVARMACGLAVLGLALLLAFGAGWSPSASAAPSTGIVVNSLADGAPANDGNCTLREAITNANNNNQSGSTDCAAGNGADSITFSVSGTIVVSPTLPAINDGLTIDGSGQSITISGNNAVRVMQVNNIGQSVTLNGLTIAYGRGEVCGGFYCGGGIYNAGTLNVTNSTLSGN